MSADRESFACKLHNSNPDIALGIKISLDGNQVYICEHVKEVAQVNFEFDDTEDMARVLEVELFGKLPEHTTVDEQNNILKDAVIAVSAVSLAGIEIDYVFQSHCRYQHNFNGSQSTQVQEAFHGHMGCNGTVTFEFSTPMYLWLLENM